MSRPVTRPRWLLALALGVATALSSSTALALAAAPRAVGVVEFPAGDERYHTYDETLAEVRALATANPGIVALSSIGRSYEGRDLVIAKVSDRVTTDEAEPEVFFHSGIHAREHLTVEMALYLYRELVNGYGRDARITRIVDNREIWIVFNANPDGSEFDISGGTYKSWRKNRQPNPGSTYIGTDLNRNFDYRWGTAGVTSDDPRAQTYHGTAPFSAPESRALRDFVASRVVGGRQQIRAGIAFHTYGQFVQWPYRYTATDVPPDMTLEDQRAFVALGNRMAALNGYTPHQGGDDYITNGTYGDWAYGVHRFFQFTFEMFPPFGREFGFYPPDEEIEPALRANRGAVLYLIEQAACPYAASGRATASCGPFYDDLELETGWTVNPYGADRATTGAWERADPDPTRYEGVRQLGTAASGQRSFVTGAAAGANATAHDVDGGLTSLRSPYITLPSGKGWTLEFRSAFSHWAATADDSLRVTVLSSAGRTLVDAQVADATNRQAAWTTRQVDLSRFAGQRIRLLFEAIDAGSSSLVEAQIDDIRIMVRT